LYEKVFFGNFGFRGAGNLAAGSVAKDNSGAKLSKELYGDIAVPLASCIQGRC
jgi:hypothetical protein